MTKTAIAIGIAAIIISGTTGALAYTGENLARTAKITVDKARTIALNVRPGTITDTELEREGGGLRYSFDIKAGNKTYEVGVDAMTGKVLENTAEGANPD
ncbi:MAG: PepSY domain-containing protein [Alphaproteobacteria bacterium]|nr:PepSY domain-containing protein [Alphaproteobacteria bacterium]MBL6936274.1 PepSY domain-containing protein [Alphaproteobacteria bacterium]MBL7098675.1 PepSY domain-containing protein [Alphaproteobacteria bacterium]